MRDMDPAFQTAVQAGTVKCAILTEADFDSGSIYLFSGYGSITIEGKTYLGAGKLLQVDPAPETGDISAGNASFQLSGVQSADLSVALNENYNGRPGRMKLAVFDTDATSLTLLGSTLQFFSGRMDVMTINDDPKGPIITMTAENDMIRLNLSRLRNYTNEDQRIDYPDDTGCGFVAAMQNKNVVW